MECLHFLPKWYLEKKGKKKIRFLKIFIIMFFTIDLILIDILILSKNKMLSIDKKIEDKIVLQRNMLSEKNKSNKKSFKTLDAFLIFGENVSKNANLQSIYIENKNIDYKYDLHSENFSMMIKKIEDTNKFNIKYIDIPCEENEDHMVKIGLELK